MTFAPDTILDVRAYLMQRTGLPAVSLGIVGDAKHAAAAVSYHLGKSQLRSDAYSLATLRDQTGVSEAASALDIGNFPRLRKLSSYLVAEARSGSLGTQDVREIIFSPDGIAVLRWDRERGVSSAPRPNEASISHRTHTHISWYRDSELRPKLSTFRKFFEGVPEMIVTKQVREKWYPTQNDATGASNGVLRAVPKRGAAIVERIPLGESIVTIAEIRTIPGSNGDWRLVETDDGRVRYALRYPDWVSAGFKTCSGPVVVAVNGSQVYP